MFLERFGLRLSNYESEIKDIIYLAKDEFECNLKDIKKIRPITTGLVA